ncbi:MAG: sigma-70 family RNA polymerase sigma factor [Oscillospiraceae bacterium]|nr:sigma-70 family RNA polymerase sigma factor [Oscillospiraceae bacterium]
MEKLDFNDIIRDNIDYIKNIVKKYAKNKSIIEELTQEIFLRAYRHYDQYIEQGKVRQWLAIIAENKLKNEYKTMKKYYNIDNYYDINDEFFQNTLAAPESSNPEDTVINSEQTERIMSIINQLPKKQRDVIIYRYMYDYSVKEVEQIMGITASNIKVTVHNALNTVREKAGININQNKLKGENTMKFDKKTAYSYLYEYAKGHISEENKSAVEEYIKTDEEAANIAGALKILHPQLVFGKNDEATLCKIKFQLMNGDKLIYSNTAHNAKRMAFGYSDISTANQVLNTFDNYGNIIEFDESIKENGVVVKVAKIKTPSYLPPYWTYSVSYIPNYPIFQKSTDSPDLYKLAEDYYSMGLSDEYYKSMEYIALPEKAQNIRVKRGNGVIKCGKYEFAYADRYILHDEVLALDFTFNMN